MSYDGMDSQLLDVAEPLTVTYAYYNLERYLVWFQVNRTPEEVAECVLVLRLLTGLDPSYFCLDRSGNESVIGLRISEGYEEFPELFGRVAQMLATYLGTPFNLTLLYKDMHPGTDPMRLPAFAAQFGLAELSEDLRADPVATLIDEIEATFADAVGGTSDDN